MSRIRLSSASSAGTALTLVLALGTPQAQAQFVCGGSTTGAEPVTGAGATATGSPGNVACGTNANASGTTSSNTATGNGANASGNSSENTATGNGANASGSALGTAESQTAPPVKMPMPAATAAKISQPEAARMPAAALMHQVTSVSTWQLVQAPTPAATEARISPPLLGRMRAGASALMLLRDF